MGGVKTLETEFFSYLQDMRDGTPPIDPALYP